MARAFTRMVRLCRLAACRGASVPVAMMVFGVPLIKPVSKKKQGLDTLPETNSKRP